MPKITLALGAAAAGLAVGVLAVAPAASRAGASGAPARPVVRPDLHPPQRSNRGWTIQPTPTISGSSSNASISLTGVSCASATSCTSVGSYIYPYGNAGGSAGGTLAEHWNGAAWTIQSTPRPSKSSQLNGVSCPSATSCTAVGYTPGGETLAEHWNGLTWKLQATHTAEGSYLGGVSCASATSCTAVGSNPAGETLAEHWNGHKWKVQATPNPSGATSAQLNGVSCVSATSCTAIGYYNTIPNNSTNGIFTLAEHWNGHSWKLQAVPNPSGANSAQLNGVSCVSSTSCTAIGLYNTGTFVSTDEALAEHWNGSTWKLQATPSAEGSILDGVSCASATSCTATGFGVDTSGNEFTLAMHSYGQRWTLQATPNPGSEDWNAIGLYGVSCPSEISCAAVGSYYGGGAADFNLPLAEQWNGGAPES